MNQVTSAEKVPCWSEALTLRQRLLQKLVMRIRPAFLASRLLRWLKPKRVLMKTRFAVLSVDPNCLMGAELTRTGEYERSMADTLKVYLKTGCVFMDVGANEGYFTVLGAKYVGSTGRVFAVEPQQRLISVIQENLALNEFTGVTVSNVALSDENNTSELYLSPATNSGASGLSEPSSHYRAQKQEVTVKRLETLLDELGLERVDVMKMDIEGFEYEAILGSQEVFKQKRIKALAIEMHDDRIRRRGKDPTQVIRFLESAGYRRETPHGCWVYVAE